MASSEIFLDSLDNWGSLCAYMSLYSVHLFVGLVLSAVTIFRKEMSCNSVFREEEGEDVITTPTSNNMQRMSVEFHKDTEVLLEGAGMYCSGLSVLRVASRCLDELPEEAHNVKKLVYRATSLEMELSHDQSDLLEKAGYFYAPQPLYPLLMNAPANGATVKPSNEQFGPFSRGLPTDVQLQIASFLHPKDVLSLSCVSKSYREAVDDADTSRALWKTLWERDYAWVVTRWNLGHNAFLRSNLTSPLDVNKELYFMFGQVYLNYLLAGHNTRDRCLVGLHGSIYDITSFVESHPGSPDTLMVHAGADSTRFFEDMIHSMRARKIAKKLCVVSSLSGSVMSDGWGLRPTPYTTLLEAEEVYTPPNHDEAGDDLQLVRRQRRRGGTLDSVRRKLEEELAVVEARITKDFASNAAAIGRVNPYYDPFKREWRLWYTNTDLEVIHSSI